MTVVKCNIPQEIKSWLQYGTCLNKENIFKLYLASCEECVEIDISPNCTGSLFCDTIIEQIGITNINCEIIIEQL
jgi:hypothetical protein